MSLLQKLKTIVSKNQMLITPHSHVAYGTCDAEESKEATEQSAFRPRPSPLLSERNTSPLSSKVDLTESLEEPMIKLFYASWFSASVLFLLLIWRVAYVWTTKQIIEIEEPTFETSNLFILNTRACSFVECETSQCDHTLPQFMCVSGPASFPIPGCSPSPYYWPHHTQDCYESCSTLSCSSLPLPPFPFPLPVPAPLPSYDYSPSFSSSSPPTLSLSSPSTSPPNSNQSPENNNNNVEEKEGENEVDDKEEEGKKEDTPSCLLCTPPTCSLFYGHCSASSPFLCLQGHAEYGCSSDPYHFPLLPNVTCALCCDVRACDYAKL